MSRFTAVALLVTMLSSVACKSVDASDVKRVSKDARLSLEGMVEVLRANKVQEIVGLKMKYEYWKGGKRLIGLDADIRTTEQSFATVGETLCGIV